MTGETPQGRAAWNSMEGRRIVIAPGEKAVCGGYVTVPKDNACLVEVVVLGDRFLYKLTQGRHIQWKAATVSLPARGGGAGAAQPPEAGARVGALPAPGSALPKG